MEGILVIYCDVTDFLVSADKVSGGFDSLKSGEFKVDGRGNEDLSSEVEGTSGAATYGVGFNAEK